MGISCNGLKPMMMMISVQIAYAGVTVFYKLAANNGMSLRVMIAYRFMFASATIIPLALLIERNNRPKLTWKILFRAFICALFGGSMAQNLYAESLVLTTATFAAALTNLIPAVTFTLAILFRMERLGLNTMAGKAKVMGTFLCIGGAMLLTFYKGAQLNIWSTHFDLLHRDVHVATSHPKTTNYTLGLLLALGCCISTSFSLIFQAQMSEMYPCNYSSTALISVMGSLQATVYALCMERDWSQWKLGWNLRLLTVAYMGIVASGIMWAFVMSVVRMRGPLYISVFNPLLLVLVSIAGSLVLNEKLHVGCVLGAAIIIIGLYSVLWGKQKEMERTNRLVPSKSSTEDGTEPAADQSIKGNLNIMAVAPNFVPERDREEPQDLEANISKPKARI